SITTATRGWPPRHSLAAAWRASRWCWASQSRENLLGAPIFNRSPSTARRRLGLIQESRTAEGSLASREASRRSHRASSTVRTPTYTHLYPQMWIVRNHWCGKDIPDRSSDHQETNTSSGLGRTRQDTLTRVSTLAHAERAWQGGSSHCAVLTW